MRELTQRSRSREPIVHLGAAILVPTVGALLLGTLALSLILRTSALAVALTMVGAALVRAAALGRAEWRRERPSTRRYLGVVVRFVAAFLLVVVATS